MSSQAFVCSSIEKKKLTCFEHGEQSVGLTVFLVVFQRTFVHGIINWEELFDSCFYLLQASY